MTWDDFKTKTYLNLLGLAEVLNNAAAKLARCAGLRAAAERRCLSGCALITGGNAGVGRATAEELVRRGSDVVLACRRRPAAEAAARELRQQSPYDGCQTGSIEVEDLDLASLTSVRALVSSLTSRKRTFDLILCNAGIMAPPERMETGDGFELQFQVNFLSHFLLTKELLHVGRAAYAAAGVHPRCVFLSSLTHHGATTFAKDLEDHDALQARRHYNPFKAYANSKLAQLLAAKEFHRRLSSEDEADRKEFPLGSAVAVHPGIVDSNLAHQYFTNEVPRWLHPVAVPVLERFVYPLFLRTPQEAAECVLYAATAPAKAVGGAYVQDGVVAGSSRASRDPALARRLWERAGELLEGKVKG